MRKRQSDFLEIGSILNRVLRKRNVNVKVGFYRMKENWTAIVGRTLANHTQPMKLSGDKLVLGVDHPEWMQQLRKLEKLVISKINKVLGKRVVKNIFFINVELKKSTRGNVDRNSGTELKGTIKNLGFTTLSVPSFSKKKEIAERLKNIKDSNLRKRLYNIFLNTGGR